VRPFLVQDYVAADSLDLALREYGPAPAANALRVAAQLAGALDFAAAVRITHGALHPRDVLLSSDDTRLTGLGITRALERIGVVAPVRRPYTAPERMAGGEWDRRADVFSLAVLMYELMWGKRVSGLGARAAQNLTEIEDADLTMLRGVFARALAENPADRYETALEFAEALKDACPDVVLPPEPVIAAPAETARGDEPRLPLIEAAEAEATVLQPAPPPPASDRREPRRRSPRRDPPDAGAAAVDRADVVQGVGPVDLAISVPPIAEPDVVYQSAAEMRHDPAPDEPASASPMGLITGHDPGSISALDRTRSAVWPLVLALGVGVAIGFAGGFFAGSREQPTVTATTAREVTQNAAPAKSEVRSQKSEVEVKKSESDIKKSESAIKKSEASNLKSEISNLKSPAAEGRQQSPAAEGRLLVRSRPAGAKVVVDGADYGPTPATVRGLARGSHRVKITRDGYAPEERRFVVTSSRPAQSMTVALAPARAVAPARAEAPTASTGRFAGALAVDSRPTGAKVFMDGTLVGTTPIALPSVPAGSHAIRLEYEGYRRWSSSVRVVASEQNRVTASLER
jgi:serine/threonine protein kinase